jgi:RNA polymerase sigma-70 factor (ECF subfamily)
MKETEIQRLGRWFDTHAARLVLYAANWIDRAGAEDVVQEVFLRLLQKPVDANQETAWLFTAVRHAAISQRRSGQRRDLRQRATSQARPDWFESSPADLIDAATAQQMLAELPEEQREVILLRIWGGLTLAEVSRITGEPMSTLFSRYRTGLTEMRKRLEPSCQTIKR